MTTRLRLRVSAGASRSGVVGRHGRGWKVRVAAPPEDGKANAAVIRLLADAVGVRTQDVAILTGHASRDKTVELRGVDELETERRLTRAIGVH